MKSYLKLFVICSLFLVPTLLFASEPEKGNPKKNSVYLEVGGTAGIYSLNYSRVLFVKNRWKLSANIGASVMPVLLYDTYSFYPIVPIGITVLYGENHHFLKIGITNTIYMGYNYQNKANDDSPISSPQYDKIFHESIFPQIGYQYQLNKTFYSNIVFSPLIYDNGVSFKLWGGIGFGVNF